MIIALALLFISSLIGAGWLGYRLRLHFEEPRKKSLPRDYLTGLNYLLNDETDKAVDIFIKMLEVDSDTVETHLAVGKLFRRRGEVDRAIRIHQNLIARPNLEKNYREQSLFELGQDYASAGVLDRAEKIFIELSDEKNHSAKALQALIDIYQKEKDWKKAIDVANKYEHVTGQSMQPVIAHYYCALGENAFRNKRIEKSIEYLEKASAADDSSVRSSLILGKVLMHKGDYKAALKALKKIQHQNPDYLSEAIDLLASCYEKLDLEDELVVYLKHLVDDYPRVPVVLILAERIRKWKGDKVAVGFVADYVRRYPSLRGLYMFVNLYIASNDGKAKDDLLILQNLMKKILSTKPDYQCKSCGFSGKILHWQCPGCRQWSTIQPVYSLEEQPA